jgi:hypothetical protein
MLAPASQHDSDDKDNLMFCKSSMLLFTLFDSRLVLWRDWQNESKNEIPTSRFIVTLYPVICFDLYLGMIFRLRDFTSSDGDGNED